MTTTRSSGWSRHALRAVVWLGATCVACWGTAAGAQDARIPVYVHASSHDGVGLRLVYELREALRGSRQLSVAATDAESVFQVELTSLDPDADTSGRAAHSTVYAMVLTMRDYRGGPLALFVTDSVGTCGSAVVRDCAADIVANVANHVSGIIEAVRAGAAGGAG